MPSSDSGTCVRFLRCDWGGWFERGREKREVDERREEEGETNAAAWFCSSSSSRALSLCLQAGLFRCSLCTLADAILFVPSWFAPWRSSFGWRTGKEKKRKEAKESAMRLFFSFFSSFFPRRRLLSITIIHQPKLFNGSRVSICRCFSVLSFSASIDRASIIAITRPGRIENRSRCPFSLLSLHPLSSQLSGRFSLNDALVLLPPTLSTLSSFSTPSTTRQTAC